MKFYNYKYLIIIILLSIFSIIQGYGQTSEISIGDKNSTSKLFFINQQYNYSRWEGIYLQSEINTKGYISDISFEKGKKDNGKEIKQVKVYIKETNLTSLSNDNWNISDYTLVYEGDILNTSTADEITIKLSTPFYYTNTKNLEIAVEHGYQKATENYMEWKYSVTQGVKRSRHGESDIDFPQHLKAKTGLPNLRLKIGCLRPVVNVGIEKGVCSEHGVEIGEKPLVTGGTPPYTYKWLPTEGLNSTEIENPKALPIVETIYEVEATDALGCKSEKEKIKVKVNQNHTQYFNNTGGKYQVCSGKFFDSGGPSRGYSYNEKYTTTFYPCDSAHYLKFIFHNFDIEEDVNCNNDWLKIYDGPDTKSPLIGKYCGKTKPNNIISTHPTGAITFEFRSDKYVTGRGWIADIICECKAVIANAGSDITICAGDSVSIGGSPAITSASGYIQFHWEPSAGLSSTTAQNPIASPDSTTTYILFLNDSICGTDADTVIVKVLPIPEAYAGNDTTILVGNSINIGTQNSVSQVNYLWSPITGLNSATISYPTANPDSTTLYTVVASNACGTDSDEVLVTVKHPLKADYAVVNESFESLGLISLNISGGEPPYIILWGDDSIPTLAEITAMFDTIPQLDSLGLTPQGVYNNLISQHSSTVLSNLDAGTYSCKVIDCESNFVNLSISVATDAFWTEPVGISIVNGELSKTAPDGWGNAYVTAFNPVSTDSITVDSLVFEVLNDSLVAAIGLRKYNNSQATTYTELDYGFYLEDGVIKIWNDSILTDSVGTFVSGDNLKMAISSSSISFIKNSQSLYNINNPESDNYSTDFVLKKGDLPSIGKPIIIVNKPKKFKITYKVTDATCTSTQSGNITVTSIIKPLFTNNIQYYWYSGTTLISNNQNLENVGVGTYRVDISYNVGINNFSYPSQYFEIGYIAIWNQSQNVEITGINTVTKNIGIDGDYDAYVNSYNALELDVSNSGWVEYTYAHDASQFNELKLGFSVIGNPPVISYGFYIYATAGITYIYIIDNEIISQEANMVYNGNIELILKVYKDDSGNINYYLNNTVLQLAPTFLNTNLYANISIASIATSVEYTRTSFSCDFNFTADKPYNKLKKKLDGSYYLSDGNTFSFIYDEEYFDNDNKLKFKIYDALNNIYSTPVLSDIDVNDEDLISQYGNNRFQLNVSSLTSDKVYILEATNDKNEKWYLRFKKQTNP